MHIFALLLLVAANAPAPVRSEACLSCHQPVGHVYGVRYEGSNMRAPNAPSGFGGTVASDFLVEGRVECTSCHVTHDVAAEAKRLRFENVQYCTACHALEDSAAE